MKSLNQCKRNGRGDHRIGCVFRRWSEKQHPACACRKYADQQAFLGPLPQSPNNADRSGSGAGEHFEYQDDVSAQVEYGAISKSWRNREARYPCSSVDHLRLSC